MILKRKSSKEITHAAKETGIWGTLQEDAAAKVLKGITTMEETMTAIII